MVPTGVSIFVATAAVDLRGDPRGTSLYVFLNRRRTRVKVLFYDQTGHCLLYKRLDRGTFRLPTVVEAGSASVGISSEELALLLRGVQLPSGASSSTRASTKKAPRIH